MTISREQLDKQLLPMPDRSAGSDEGLSPKCRVPPFDEPIYTVNEAARILRLSPNQARSIFRNEPGVHDLSAISPRARFLRRKSQLRIPHAVLVRFWNRTELGQRRFDQTAISGKGPGQRAA
jgi:hypothetical protein